MLILCKKCGKYFHHLGISRHRAAHYDKMRDMTPEEITEQEFKNISDLPKNQKSLTDDKQQIINENWDYLMENKNKCD